MPGRVLTVDLKWGESSNLRIVAVYAPSGNNVENAELWTKLRDKWRSRREKRSDILMGDLNMVECAIDRMPPRPDRAAVVEAFQEMKRESKLVDGWQMHNLNSPPKFTFQTTHSGSTNSRSQIDRIYVQEYLLERSYEWEIVDSRIKTTDHFMVCAFITPKETPHVGSGRSTIGTFTPDHEEIQEKFMELTIALEDDIEALGANGRTPTRNPQTLWKDYKSKLREIGREFSMRRASQIDKEIKLWEKRKETILALPNLGELDDKLATLDEIEDNITNLLVAKTMRERTKIETRHLKVAETNTKYDYNLHREKSPRDIIPRLQIPGSEPALYETSSKRMTEIATAHHEDLQNENDQNRSQEEMGLARDHATSFLKPRLSCRQKNKMGRQIRVSKVRSAIKDIANGKASGLDGIPIEVWKHLLKIRDIEQSKAECGEEYLDTANIAQILQRVLNDIVQHGVVPGSDFAEGWLCPLYKKKDRAEIGNYRPITVLNTDYKILTKILTERISVVAPLLIHPDQAGFIKGRSIFDQTELIRLVMESTNDTRGAIVCLDQEKAYDKIHHKWLWRTLDKLNFPSSYTTTIKHLYSDAKTAVILNGVVGRKYSITRGVRQGDPLSCILFDLAIESLATMLRESSLKGLNFEGIDTKILSNLFADDTTVFLNKNDDFGELLSILERWCTASGAKFNIAKTVIIPLGEEQDRDEMRSGRRLGPNSITIPTSCT